MKVLSVVVLVLIAAFVGYICYTSPVGPFSAFFDAVEPGMDRLAVEAALARQFPEGGRFPQPVAYTNTAEWLSYVLDPNDGRYNAEIIAFQMDKDTVVSKTYYPD